LDRIKNILNPSLRSDIPYLFDNFEIWKFKEDNNWENLLNEGGQKYKNFRRGYGLDDKIVFGLPIVSDRRYKDKRRASPLIFKILETGANNYTLLFIIMRPNKCKFIFHPNIRNEYVRWCLLLNFVAGRTKIYP